MAEAAAMPSVLFDVDGVLIHGWHAREDRRRRWDATIEADLGIDPVDFSAGFFPGPFVEEVLPGKRSLIDALGAWLRMRGYRISPMELARYWFEQDSVRDETLLALVGDLRATGRCRLYVATNQEHLRAMHLWGALGFSQLFEDMFYAARLGALKPDPRFFRAIDAIIGPQSQPPLLFDDSHAVVEAARVHGWDAVLYDRIEDCRDHPAIATILAER